ncbi:MFS general substrate transporter [Lentithecium fluviatile CBS 122367]|uniref:MFS general substrate transporter n=1 Tax=Lentithecium fluviatile CBS 122367 TaxID=1168545 RepID=A0A6G1JPH6_9PLEO|nr:MFS general substrate transporter [Lentithecium fluviatile CBS 122367]
MDTANNNSSQADSPNHQFVTSPLDPKPLLSSNDNETGLNSIVSEAPCLLPKRSENTFFTSSRIPFFIVIVSLFFGTFLVALDATIIGTAIPAITTEYYSLDDIGWYGIGSILCAAAPTSNVFIAGRAIQGCGAAGILQGALVIITRTVPLEKRPFYMSIVISAFGLYVKNGPLIGGAFTQNVTWRWCFWINVPVGGLVAVMLLVFLKLNPHVTEGDEAPRSLIARLKTIDLGGMILIISSVCSLLFAMQWGGQNLLWTSSKVVGLFVGSGLIFAIFVLFQYKLKDNATLPFHILFQRSIFSGALYLFVFAMSTYVYGYYLPIYFQSVKGTSALISGINFLALALPQIGFTVLSGWLASRFGYYTPYLIGGTLVSVPGSYLLTMLDLNTNLGTWVAFFLVVAIGTGLSINHPYTAVQAILTEANVPVGNAIMQFTFSLGGALSLCVAQTIFANKLRHEVLYHVSEDLVDEVLAAGAYGLPDLSQGLPDRLLALRHAYRNALLEVFIFALAASGAELLCSLFFEHLNLKLIAEDRKQMESRLEHLNVARIESETEQKLPA